MKFFIFVSRQKYFRDRKEIKFFSLNSYKLSHFHIQDQFDTMKCCEFKNLHNDIIRQVFYSSNLNSIVSASESTMTSNAYLPGVIITNLGIQKSQTVFKMNSVS